jgi:hypothetical protein
MWVFPPTSGPNGGAKRNPPPFGPDVGGKTHVRLVAVGSPRLLGAPHTLCMMLRVLLVLSFKVARPRPSKACCTLHGPQLPPWPKSKSHPLLVEPQATMRPSPNFELSRRTAPCNYQALRPPKVATGGSGLLECLVLATYTGHHSIHTHTLIVLVDCERAPVCSKAFQSCVQTMNLPGILPVPHPPGGPFPCSERGPISDAPSILGALFACDRGCCPRLRGPWLAAVRLPVALRSESAGFHGAALALREARREARRTRSLRGLPCP